MRSINGVGGLNTIYRFNDLLINDKFTVEWEGRWYGRINHFYSHVFNFYNKSNNQYFFRFPPQNPVSNIWVGIYDNDGILLGKIYKEFSDYMNFHKYTFTWDGRYLKVYIDGSLFAEKDVGHYVDVSGTKYFFINGGYNYSKFIETKNMRIYNRALTEEEVRDNVDSWDNPKHKSEMIFWIDAEDYNPYEGTWRDRVSGIEGQWVGVNKINGYEMKSNVDWAYDIENYGNLRVLSLSEEKNITLDVDMPDSFTIEYDIVDIEIMKLFRADRYVFKLYYDNDYYLRLYSGICNEGIGAMIKHFIPIYYYNDNDEIISHSWPYWYSKGTAPFGTWMFPIKIQIIYQADRESNNFTCSVYYNGYKIEENTGSWSWPSGKLVRLNVESVKGTWNSTLRFYGRALSENELQYNLNNWNNPIQDDSLWFWIDLRKDYINSIDEENNYIYVSDRFDREYKFKYKSWVGNTNINIPYKSRIGVISNE